MRPERVRRPETKKPGGKPPGFSQRNPRQKE
jgi:hypothetical protein